MNEQNNEYSTHVLTVLMRLEFFTIQCLLSRSMLRIHEHEIIRYELVCRSIFLFIWLYGCNDVLRVTVAAHSVKQDVATMSEKKVMIMLGMQFVYWRSGHLYMNVNMDTFEDLPLYNPPAHPLVMITVKSDFIFHSQFAITNAYLISVQCTQVQVQVPPTYLKKQRYLIGFWFAVACVLRSFFNYEPHSTSDYGKIIVEVEFNDVQNLLFSGYIAFSAICGLASKCGTSVLELRSF